MYVEISSNNHGYEKVFVSWERTDIIQISKITFCFNRLSILTNDSLKSMGRFRIQLLLHDNTWSTQYTIPKTDRYSDTSTDWTLLNLDFTVENYGIKLFMINLTHLMLICVLALLQKHILYFKNSYISIYTQV